MAEQRVCDAPGCGAVVTQPRVSMSVLVVHGDGVEERIELDFDSWAHVAAYANARPPLA